MRGTLGSSAVLSCWVKKAGRNFFTPSTCNCIENVDVSGSNGMAGMAGSPSGCHAEGCPETHLPKSPTPPESPTGSSLSLYEVWSAFGVSYPCVGCGNFLGYTSSAVPSMIVDSQSFLTITSTHVSLIGGLGPLGALVGSLLTALTSRFLGTRRTIGFLGIPSLLLSWILLYFATTTNWILIARLIGGVGVGIVIATAPLYIVDICSVSRRGKLGILPQFLMLFGILLSYIAGTFLDWNNLALVSCLILLPSFPLILLSPDSPTWLLSRDPVGNESQVSSVLHRLKGSSSAASQALQQLKDKMDSRRKSLKVDSPSVWSEILSPQTFKPFLVSVSLICLQQLTGINGVTFFALTILTPNSTHPPQSSMTNVSAIILASTQVVASFASSFLVERCGRKFLLLLSSSLVFFAGVSLGVYFFLKESSLLPPAVTSSPLAPLALLMTFAFGFALGLGPVTWILIAEILPQETRHLLNPIVIAFNWLCTFAVTSSFPWLLQLVDLYGIFWIYATVAGVGVAFVRLFIPETKGKSQEEIKELFSRKR